MCWSVHLNGKISGISKIDNQLYHCILLVILLSNTVLSRSVSSPRGSGSTMGELRCYCNLPNCIPNGYMCKTSGPGRCFFFLEYSRVTVQGCTDLFPSRSPPQQQQKQPITPPHCDYHQGAQSFPQLVNTVRQRLREESGAHRPTVGCCQRHMCNHVEYTDPLETRLRAALANRSSSDRSGGGSSSPTAGGGNRVVNNGWYWQSAGEERSLLEQHHLRVTDQEMWFKAAVIAVPIAGGFIMLVLVFIAFRLLRQDAHLRRKYHSYDSPPGATMLGQQQQLFYPEASPSQPILAIDNSATPWPTLDHVKKGTAV